MNLEGCKEVGWILTDLTGGVCVCVTIIKIHCMNFSKNKRIKKQNEGPWGT